MHNNNKEYYGFSTKNDEFQISYQPYNESKVEPDFSLKIKTNDKEYILYYFDNYIYDYFPKNTQIDLYPSDDMFIYFNKKYVNESLHILSSKSQFFLIKLPYINQNYKFFKNYGITDENGYFINDIYEFQIPFNSKDEVKFFFSNQFIPKFSNSIIFGFSKNYYPEISEIKIEEINFIEPNENVYFSSLNKSYFFKSFKTA